MAEEKKCCWSKCFKLFKKKKIVNVLNLEGVIGSVNFKQGLTLYYLNKHLEEAFKGKNVKAVILNINSPGGSPVQSELITKRIMQLAEESKIPVISVIEDIAASGGYWIACAGNEIIVAKNSILGNLGVRFSGFGFTKAIERLGVERRVYTQGESKALLDPFLPEKEADIDIIMQVQEDIYKNFKGHVLASRGERLKMAEKETFSGAIWSGNQSVDNGIADKIGDLYSEIRERFGKDVDIRIINQEKSWLKRKLSLLFEGVISGIVSGNKFELR
jgi:signal peptide peptidase SppA